MSGAGDLVAAAYIEACLAELDAPKPGNVHRFAPGHGMEVADFVRSAEASAAPIASTGRPRRNPRPRRRRCDAESGRSEHQSRHHTAVCAARRRRGDAGCAVAPGARRTCSTVSIVSDAADVFSAIAAANPRGLGRAPRHDVNAPATVTLREAMAEAAGRDRIARQYVTAYDDIFSLGLPVLETAASRGTKRAGRRSQSIWPSSRRCRTPISRENLT